MENVTTNNLGKGFLNTLAQNGTGPTHSTNKTDAAVVSGQGADISKISVLKNRAKKKTITQATVLGILKVAEAKKRTDRLNTYWNVYHCQEKITTANERLYGKYCKNRMCTICSGIRKALIINKYLPEINTWEDPHFVTLTAKSVSRHKLKARFQSLNRGFRKINNKYKKRAQRGTGQKLKGIRSIESNFNPDKKTYNPHIHILVPNKETAEILRREWLEICTPEFALVQCQDIRRVGNMTKALIEAVKYGTKVFTEPGSEKRKMSQKDREIYAAALFNIFEAMKGIRIFERFGFSLPKQVKRQALTTRIEPVINNWEFDNKRADWINTETGNPFSGYVVPWPLQEILENGLDTELE